MSHVARIGGLVGALTLLAGCTTISSGQPSPIGSAVTSPTASPESSTSTSGAMPARPREIRLDGKDPCALVPESDWPRFHIEKQGDRRPADPTFKSPDCFYGGNLAAFGIIMVITEGIEKWTDGSRSGVVKQVEPIEGFSAIAITRREDKNQCDVAVDVAKGQYLLAGVLVTPRTASQLPERCDYARQWAESAMKTLVKS